MKVKKFKEFIEEEVEGTEKPPRKKYTKPEVEKIKLDRDISFVMMSTPGGDPPSKRHRDDDGGEETPFGSPFR